MQKNNKILRIIRKVNLFLIFAIALIVLLVIAFLFFSLEHTELTPEPPKPKTIHNSPNLKDEEIHKYFEEKTDSLQQDYIHDEISKTIHSDTNKTMVLKKPADTTVAKTQARLLIVIDDVTLKSQIEAVQLINYPINLSVMPPTSIHPNSAVIVQNLSNYMVHLPLQAHDSSFEEEKTLHTNDSYEIIERRIAEIRRLYPNAKFINNHTGSKFSEDSNATDKLLQALAKYHFAFLDSKTTSNSTLCSSANKFGVRCLERNIFLDNEQNVSYIEGQLKKAIAHAKKTGFAIAIGHPHKETLEVLRNAQGFFVGVELMYIEQI